VFTVAAIATAALVSWSSPTESSPDETSAETLAPKPETKPPKPETDNASSWFSWRNIGLAAAACTIGYFWWPWSTSQSSNAYRLSGGYQAELKRGSGCGDADIVIQYRDPSGKVMSANEFANALKGNSSFQKAVNESLQKVPSTRKNGYYLKGPKINKDTKSDPFYWVINGSTFPTNPDPKPFQDYLNNGDTRFTSLGGTNRLVIPKNSSKATEGHISNFVNKADPAHQQEFWKDVGSEFVDQLGKIGGSNYEFYPNTHGHGVDWLHFRYDKKPTYYNAGNAMKAIANDPRDFYGKCLS